MNPKRHYFAYRSFWPELDTRRRFRDEVGVRVNQIIISNTANSLGFPYTKYPPVWKWNGVYDWEAFDRQLDDLLEAVPDTRVILMLDLNTPHWWTRYLGAFGVRYDSFYELGKVSASPTWLNDTAEYLRQVIVHAELHYASVIDAYVLGGGGATEWHDRSRGEESIYRLAAFRRWQREHGLPETDIPSRLQRDCGSHDFCNGYVDRESYYNGNDPTGGMYREVFPHGVGLLRSPDKDQPVLDYLRFCAEHNADTVAFFFREARKSLRHPAELGCFFGYEFAPWTMHAGHLAYEKLLAIPELDFLIAPVQHYKLGEHSESATIHATIARYGKRMLQEFDQKCWCYNRVMSDCCTLPAPRKNEPPRKYDGQDGKDMAKNFTFGDGNGWDSPEHVVAGIRRDIAMAIINGDSLWWFDMWGGFYQHREVFEALRQSREIYEAEIGHDSRSVAQVLVVVDPENMLLINDLNERAGTFHNKITAALGRSGMPYDQCSFNDLESLDLNGYRLVVLCHPFDLPQRKRAILSSKILRDGRTVLLVYGVVIDADGKWNPRQTAEFCGINYATPRLTTHQMDGWRSAYIFRAEDVTPEDMRNLAVGAGCHVWCDKLRPVYANERLAALHTAVPEKLTLTLPRKSPLVTELYTGQTWTDTAEIHLETSDAKTWFFQYQ